MIDIITMTHNRIEYVEELAASFSTSYNHLIFDDASDIKSFATIAALFPTSRIYRQPSNGKPPINVLSFAGFRTGEYLCVLDSDCKVTGDLDTELKSAIKVCNDTTCVSLYNSVSHPDVGNPDLTSQGWHQHDSIGGCNLIIKWDLWDQFMQHYAQREKKMWDWNLVWWAKENGIRIMVRNHSTVEHIGANGLHSREHSPDIKHL